MERFMERFTELRYQLDCIICLLRDKIWTDEERIDLRYMLSKVLDELKDYEY